MTPIPYIDGRRLFRCPRMGENGSVFSVDTCRNNRTRAKDMEKAARAIAKWGFAQGRGGFIDATCNVCRGCPLAELVDCGLVETWTPEEYAARIVDLTTKPAHPEYKRELIGFSLKAYDRTPDDYEAIRERHTP